MELEDMQMPEESLQNKTKEESIKSNLLLYLHDIVYLLSGVLLVLLLCFRVVIVSGPSMNQTLVHGDWLILIGNVLYNEPQRGDVVVASKDSFEDGEPIIKRVIATQGHEVDIDFDAGIVYVDGEALDEPYTNTPTNIREGMEFPLIVEEGCVFLMGDNRNKSKDSRSTEIGLVDCRELLGKAVFLVFPGQDEETESRDFTRIGAIS